MIQKVDSMTWRLKEQALNANGSNLELPLTSFVIWSKLLNLSMVYCTHL